MDGILLSQGRGIQNSKYSKDALMGTKLTTKSKVKMASKKKATTKKNTTKDFKNMFLMNIFSTRLYDLSNSDYKTPNL